MKTVKEYRNRFLRIFITTGFILLFVFGYGIYNTVALNRSKVKIVDNVTTGNIFIEQKYNRNDTDYWQSILQLSENPVIKETYIGETCSFNLKNIGKFNITKWNLKLNIKQDCYLNGFWCGDFEVHQFRDGKEIVALVKNGQNDISDTNLEYNSFSNALLIHLVPGDYLVYYPSHKVQEDFIKIHSSVGIGFIFYYKNNIDLSDYEISYFNNVNLIKTVHFKIWLLFVFLWIVGLVFFHAFLIIDQAFTNEMNTAINNISIMAELYQEVHLINNESETGYLIKGDKNNLLFNFFGYKAQDYFDKYIEEDCKEEYINELARFLDLKSVQEIMESVSSISFEYESKKMGWICLRFFKFEKNNKIFQLIFTVEDINKEKKKQEIEQERIKQNDFSQLFINRFIDTFTFSSDEILDNTMKMNEQLKKELVDYKLKQISTRVGNSVEHYKLLQNCVYDMFKLEANSFSVKNNPYNLNEIINKVVNILVPFYENKNVEFQKIIDENIPEILEGDSTRLMQIFLLLLYSSFYVSNDGVVKLSVFTKNFGDEEELLISIKDSGMGFNEEEMKEVYSFLAGLRINSFENPSLVYLKIIDGILKNMNSELKIVSVYKQGTEFYFSIRQKILKKEKNDF